MKLAPKLEVGPACPSVRRERQPAGASAQAGSRRALNTLYTLFFYFSILLFLIGFNFTDAPMQSGWYQQFMPNLGGRVIRDMTFTDSLNGYAITNKLSETDTSFILKTSDGGDNWFFVLADSAVTYNRIQFINQTTGFVGGYIPVTSTTFGMLKTTNAGSNWFYINFPYNELAEDMHVLNEDTIWFVESGFFGGVFRTTNGGVNWDHLVDFGSGNPDHIYMFNARIGFCSETGSYTRKTTDGGETWFIVALGNGMGFYDMFFADSLTGWGTFYTVRKTTNGGINWIDQTLPSGGNLVVDMRTISNVNRDTIWGGGQGYIFFPGNGGRGIIYVTKNGGDNWYFQLPDTSFRIAQFPRVNFINKLNGWAYSATSQGGVHTVTGGNDTFFTAVKEINSTVPKEFVLFQNFPNPFNPNTNVKYQLKQSRGQMSEVRIVVYDIVGKEISILVNRRQSPGEYAVEFDGSALSSGIYFYSLFINGELIDTKRMVLLK